MRVIALKVRIIGIENEETTLRLSPKISIRSIVHQLCEKYKKEEEKYGLFYPFGEKVRTCGQWLHSEKPLEFYDFNPHETIELKKKEQILQFKLGKGNEIQKKIIIDTSLCCEEIVAIVSKKIGIKNSEEYAIQSDKNPNAWMRSEISLPEQVDSMDKIFLLKRKFYYKPSIPSIEDSLQLNIAYIDSRDEIIEGKHPCLKDEAIEFGALQVQIELGDHTEKTKNVQKNIENILPPIYQSSKDALKRVAEKWEKHRGLEEINAKKQYVDCFWKLKTSGMSVFKVKNFQKEKSRDAFLCIGRRSIILLDHDTLNTTKEYPLSHLQRWVASPETFTLDFGSFEEKVIVFVTLEGETISHLIQGYIDFQVKRRKDSTVDEDSIIYFESESDIDDPQKPEAMTFQSAIESIDRIINEVDLTKTNQNLSLKQKKGQVNHHCNSMIELLQLMEKSVLSAKKSKTKQNIFKMLHLCDLLITAIRQVEKSLKREDVSVVETVTDITEFLKDFFKTSEICLDSPRNPSLKASLSERSMTLEASLHRLAGIINDVKVDEDFEGIFQEKAMAYILECENLLKHSKEVGKFIVDEFKKRMFEESLGTLDTAKTHFRFLVGYLNPTISMKECQSLLLKAAKKVENAAAFVVSTTKSSGIHDILCRTLENHQIQQADALHALESHLIGKEAERTPRSLIGSGFYPAAKSTLNALNLEVNKKEEPKKTKPSKRVSFGFVSPTRKRDESKPSVKKSLSLRFSKKKSDSNEKKTDERKSIYDNDHLNNVSILERIGGGQHGEVFRGIYEDSVVALKLLSKGRNKADFAEDEVNILKSLQHPNVVRYYGTYLHDNQLYVVMDYIAQGSLDRFLRNFGHTMQLDDLLSIARQMVAGMKHLEKNKIVHRDLALRNILVITELLDKKTTYKIKISDFGMSRITDLYLSTDDRLPVRWSAPEALQYREFSPKSDVWSLGVCFWELFSLGLLPYASMSNQEVFDAVLRGLRLEQPKECPDWMYILMNQCWAHKKENRPTFEEIHSQLMKNRLAISFS